MGSSVAGGLKREWHTWSRVKTYGLLLLLCEGRRFAFFEGSRERVLGNNPYLELSNSTAQVGFPRFVSLTVGFKRCSRIYTFGRLRYLGVCWVSTSHLLTVIPGRASRYGQVLFPHSRYYVGMLGPVSEEIERPPCRSWDDGEESENCNFQSVSHGQSTPTRCVR